MTGCFAVKCFTDISICHLHKKKKKGKSSIQIEFRHMKSLAHHHSNVSHVVRILGKRCILNSLHSLSVSEALHHLNDKPKQHRLCFPLESKRDDPDMQPMLSPDFVFNICSINGEGSVLHASPHGTRGGAFLPRKLNNT